ncbi:MAG: radical SAM protein [Deltaproteobacteria bacterium]|nr:radical SAM protein [Deltaproteobacteria bacterium]
MLAQLRLHRDAPTRSPAGTQGGFRHLPVELFEAFNQRHALDAASVQFVEVDEVGFDVLKLLREEDLTVDELTRRLPQHSPAAIQDAWDDLREAQDGGFLVPQAFRRVPQHENDQYQPMLSSRMAGLTISITTQCNLACSYCIFGGQYGQHPELSRVTMSWETLQNAMDFLYANSHQSEKIRVDYFGGEPLIAFHLIERGVRYLKERLSTTGRHLDVTITTNGTILTERILDFLIEHEVYVQVSIDGNKEIHDRNRLLKSNDRGSFDIVMGNLQRIHDRSPAYFRKHVRVKGVITSETVEIDAEEFFRHPLMALLVEDGHLSLLNEEPNYELASDGDFFARLHRLGERLLQASGKRTVAELLEPLNVQQKQLFWLTFAEFFDVQVVNKVHNGRKSALPFRKGCLMGFEEGNVNPKGEISVCHKAQSFVIGNVNEGTWYFDRIKDLNARLHDSPSCGSCFVQRFCSQCHEKLNGSNLAESKRSFCEFTRHYFRTIFNTMLRVLERNPELWNELDRMLEKAVAPATSTGLENQSASAAAC